MKSRLLRALFASYVVGTALHIAYVLMHEPFSFDAWNVAVDTKAQPFTLERFFGYVQFEYTHSNPRLGQALTYLSYKLEYVGEVALALSYLTLTFAVTVLALGRWPWKRPRDLALWAIAIGFGWFAFPEIGRNMFCRAYGANYVFGAAVQLAFLVPLRLSRSYDDVSLARCIGYGVFGFVAGICNEHTGPTLIAFFAGYAWWLHRKGERPRLVWAGGVGVALGFAMLFFAPGQSHRYDALAQRMSLPARMLRRGIEGNLDIFRDYIIYAAPLLGLVLIVLLIGVAGKPDSELAARRRSAIQLTTLALVAGCTLAATLFVSPKLGSRFFIVSNALLLAGLIALLDATIARPRVLAPFVVLAICASAYAASRTIPLFTRVAAQGEARMRALEATKPGAIFVADAFDQVDESWWYIGDDFRDYLKRELVTEYFGLGRVFFRGYNAKAPLGVLGVKLVPRYETAAGTSAEDLAFDLGVSRGFDLRAVHESIASSIDLLQARIAPDPLRRYEILVDFIGAWPPMPRRRIVLARWADGRLEAHAGALVRKGRSRTRTIDLPDELARKPFEIFVVQVGDEPRRLGTTDGKPLQYIPWRTGVYWVLACDERECWVIAASRQGG